MKISMLKKREPLEQILPATLERFLFSRFGEKFVVCWRRDNQGDWLINEQLNVVFHRQAELAIVLAQSKREFSRSVRWWRRGVQALYVRLATQPRLAKYFCGQSLDIAPAPLNYSKISIIGGNHHLRLIDYGEQHCYVIAKSDFNNDFLKNDIAIRLKHAYLPAPSILDVNETDGWYSEEIIYGTPLNRLADARLIEANLTRVKKILSRFYQETRQTEKAGDYARQMLCRIQNLIRSNQLLITARYTTAFDTLQQCVKDLSLLCQTLIGSIITAQTHGDFQPANILVGQNRFWLIDWEYTARRQVDYDFLVYELGARSTNYLAQSMAKRLNDVDNQSANSKSQTKQKIIIFLLEELELRLTENNNPCLTSIDSGLARYIAESKKIIHLLSMY